jgi:hypothetical protein
MYQLWCVTIIEDGTAMPKHVAVIGCVCAVCITEHSKQNASFRSFKRPSVPTVASGRLPVASLAVRHSGKFPRTL